RFDNVLDSGLFHVFSDADRIRYVRGLNTVLNPGGVCSCFVSATPPRGRKDRDASRSPSCAMPLPMVGKSNPSSPCASKSALTIDREPSPAKTRAAGSLSPTAWLKPLLRRLTFSLIRTSRLIPFLAWLSCWRRLRPHWAWESCVLRPVNP